MNVGRCAQLGGARGTLFLTFSHHLFSILHYVSFCCTIYHNIPYLILFVHHVFPMLKTIFQRFPLVVSCFFITFQDTLGFDITICDGEVVSTVPDSWRRLGNERIDPRPTLQATSRMLR